MLCVYRETHGCSFREKPNWQQGMYVGSLESRRGAITIGCAMDDSIRAQDLAKRGIDGEAAQVVGAREMSPSTIKHSASWREWRALCFEQHYSVRQRRHCVALDREGGTCGVWNNDDGVGYVYVPVRLKDIHDGSLHLV